MRHVAFVDNVNGPEVEQKGPVAQMTAPTCELQSASIVLVGQFHAPPRFHPAELALRGVLSKEDASSATINIVASDICDWSNDWLGIVVNKERLEATSLKPDSYPLLKDLVLGCFSSDDSDMFHQIGFNRQMHFASTPEILGNVFGTIPVPEQMKAHGIGAKAFGASIQIPITSRPGSILRIKYEPSIRVKVGLFVDTNEHAQVAPGSPREPILALIRDRWMSALNEASEIAGKLAT
ncbi:MAG: hypothetical protein AAB074_11660 [Planctomycetota bacterium]